MATITKRGNTYRIRTSCGYTVDGKQVVKSMTYKPREGMSEKQIEKEVRRQAVLFEESCKKGQAVTAAKFETFAREWFRDCAELKLKRLTLCNYHRMEKRVYAALGMGAEEFSQKLALLLGERERYADAELRSWAHKAAQSRKKCAISFTEDELFAVLKESVGR